MSNREEEIEQFITMTNASYEEASEYIDSFGDLEGAIEGYFAAQGNEVTNDFPERMNNVRETTEPLRSMQGQALGSERPAAASAGSAGSFGQSQGQSRTVKNNTGNSKFMSFSDMVRGNADAEEEDEDRPRNTFAGGETSGLEVTDPNDSNSLIKDLLEKAARGGEQAQGRDDGERAERKPRNFTGKGYRLGAVVDAPSAVVEDNTPAASREPEKAVRQITFWKEGFQVGEGQLYRYDDPSNAHYLNELNQGRAPLKLLDVQYGQEVEVNVLKKLDESFKPPKASQAGFRGEGQRLGSPIPGDEEASQPFTQPVMMHKPESATEETTKPAEPEAKGDTSIQIRYANGKREVYHCNSTDTVQSLYDHVKENTVDQSRAFTLNHTFPVKAIDNFHATIGESDLKNSAIVQRWV